MGGDGQTFTNKRKLLEASRIFSSANCQSDGSRRTHGADKESVRERFTHCAMSLEPLEAPVVVDMQGNVFSKRSVVDYLLGQKQGSSADGTEEGSTSMFSHIRRLRDVCELQCGANSAGEPSIECVMTGSVASYGAHRFVAIWDCGHVFTQSWLTKNVAPVRGAGEGRPAPLGSARSVVSHDESKPSLVRCPICVPPTDITNADDTAQRPRKLESDVVPMASPQGTKGKKSKKSSDVGVIVRLLPASLEEASEQGKMVAEALKNLQQGRQTEQSGGKSTGGAVKPPEKRPREATEL